jgi:hypothetical protein
MLDDYLLCSFQKIHVCDASDRETIWHLQHYLIGVLIDNEVVILGLHVHSRLTLIIDKAAR